jgi:hypothetical protein
MGENMRRVAKIISFEVSSVNEMIKINVIFVNTQGLHFFYRKALVKLDTPPPLYLSFLSILFSHDSLDTSFLLFSIIYRQYIDNIVSCVCVCVCVKEEEEEEEEK